jgi:Ulp1 family protease
LCIRWLQDEHMERKKVPLDMSDWELIPTPRDTPQQTNGVDCGVYTTCFAYLMSNGLPLRVRTFHQAASSRLSVCTPTSLP